MNWWIGFYQKLIEHLKSFLKTFNLLKVFVCFSSALSFFFSSLLLLFCSFLLLQFSSASLLLLFCSFLLLQFSSASLLLFPSSSVLFCFSSALSFFFSSLLLSFFYHLSISQRIDWVWLLIQTGSRYPALCPQSASPATSAQIFSGFYWLVGIQCSERI